MSTYSRFQRPRKDYRREQHPIWRGIGCLMIVILPLISYALAVSLVNYGLAHGYPYPNELLGYIHFPAWVWRVPVLSSIAQLIGAYRNLPAVLISYVIAFIFLTGLFSTLYAIIYRFVGPSKITPVDAPPSKYRPRKYKR